MAESEDDDQTLIFVDMLGFGALVTKHKFRVVQDGPDEHGFTGWSTTPIQSVFYRFNLVLDLAVREEELNGGLQAMLFSDCAYIRVGNPIRAVIVAVALMRQFMKFKVPVRMGLGAGTFYDFQYSTNTSNGSMLVSKSRFLGTAVLNAYAAEQCGGKGMRIFIDSSLRDTLTHPGQCSRVMRLQKPLKRAAWELNYLHDQHVPGETPTAEEADAEIFNTVAALKDPRASLSVRRHYIDTLKALNRMSYSLGRPVRNLRQLKYGTALD